MSTRADNLRRDMFRMSDARKAVDEMAYRARLNRERQGVGVSELAKQIGVTAEVIKRFEKNPTTVSYGNARAIAAALNVPFPDYIEDDEPESIIKPSTEIWTPRPPKVVLPPQAWMATAPGCFLVAIDLLKKGKPLHAMTWRQFEELLASLLESDGWKVRLMQGSKDGGIDVAAEKQDPCSGPINALWQAKKYTKQKVEVSAIRELGYVRDKAGASKGIIATTTSLTRGALNEVQRDKYRFGSKNGREIEQWVRRTVFGDLQV